MDNNKYFKQVMQKLSDMSDEEFYNFIDSIIEQTELIGGLTTNIRSDILTFVFQQEEYENNIYDYFWEIYDEL